MHLQIANEICLQEKRVMCISHSKTNLRSQFEEKLKRRRAREELSVDFHSKIANKLFDQW